MKPDTEVLQSAIDALLRAVDHYDLRNISHELTDTAITDLRALMSRKVEQDPILVCEIKPRPLSYPLSDYHIAISEGPLNYTWRDKPHRLIYDLIAAVKFYAQPTTSAQPLTDFDIRGKLATLKCWHRLTEEESVELVERMKPQQPLTEAEQVSYNWLKALCAEGIYLDRLGPIKEYLDGITASPETTK